MSMMNGCIHELFAKAVERSGTVGIQLSILTDDEQLDLVHGSANAELDIPLTQDTVVQLGSVTKVFNAMMIMSLVEEGRLDLDVPVKRYIPEFQVADPNATQTITLRHLLSMSAGIDNGDYGDYGTGDDALAKRVAALTTLPQHFRPGTYWGYSNAGIDISGYVAERVTGQVWDDLLRERVLEPAGLKNAASLDRDRMFQRVAVGHMVERETGKVTVVRPWHASSRGLAPTGTTLTVSAHDLARLGKLFLTKGLADSGTRVLSEHAIKVMMTPHTDVPVHYCATSWCLGPLMHEWSQVRVWGHNGGYTAGGSFLYWVPEKNGVIACTFNTPSLYSHLFKVTTQEMMNAAFGVANPGIQAPASPIEIDPERYTGTYECLAGQILVEVVDEKLVMKTEWDMMGRIVETAPLVPLGGDRFLMDKGVAADAMELPQDVAFFGEDAHGRASNMIRGVFPSTRK